MDMVARQHTVDDRHAHLRTDLPDDLANPQAHLTVQHLEPIFRRPDEMITMMKCRVTTAAVAHRLLAESKAEATIQLKSEGLLHLEDSKSLPPPLCMAV